MKKIISVLSLSLIISGCSSNDRKVEIVSKPVEKPKLNVLLPEAVKMLPISWVLITEKNYEEVIEKSKGENGLVFLIALDEENYKNLALNNTKILKHLREQRYIIASYKKYYENSNESQ